MNEQYVRDRLSALNKVVLPSDRDAQIWDVLQREIVKHRSQRSDTQKKGWWIRFAPLSASIVIVAVTLVVVQNADGFALKELDSIQQKEHNCS